MAADELDRYALASRLFALLAPELAAEGLELVDARVFRGGGRLQVRLYVGSPGREPVDLETCVRASRSAGMLLEAADTIAEPYVLEVSSPGVRRPLRTTAHFDAAVGKAVELRVRFDGKPRRVRGRLDAADDDRLTVAPVIAAVDDGTAPESNTGVRGYGPVEMFARQDVLEANVDEELDVQALINADRRRRKEEKREQRQARRQEPRGRVRGKNRREP